MVNGTTRLRVREGQVQWHAANGDSTLPAGTEVLIDRHMNVTRGAVAQAGQQWAWIETMAPELDQMVTRNPNVRMPPLFCFECEG